MILGYLLSLFAAALWGVSHVVAKVGVTNLATPLVGATFSTFAGAGVFSAIAIRDHRDVIHCQRTSLIFICLAGVFASLALAFQFMSFSLIPVIIASPLTCTYPIITAGMAPIFLKKEKKVTLRVILGAVCVVLGGALITLGRP